MTRPRRWRRMWVRGPAGERGAVAVVVALLFPLLMGAAALAVDTAAVWNARAQVFSSVDALALAAAMDCAEQRCPSKTAAEAMITHYGVLNNAGAKLASLQPGTGWLQTDPNQKATRGQGTWRIKHYFGAAVGVPDVALTVETMARWSGRPSATSGLPLAVSWCTYREALQRGGGVGSTQSTATLSVSTPAGSTSCNGPAGETVSGAATILTSASSSCGTSSAVGQSLNTATTTPSSCSVSYYTGLVGHDVVVPVYDQSGNGKVRIYGYAALRVTSVTTGSPATVTGYFTFAAAQIDTPATVPTVPDLGARAVFLWDPDDWQGTRCPC